LDEVLDQAVDKNRQGCWQSTPPLIYQLNVAERSLLRMKRRSTECGDDMAASMATLSAHAGVLVAWVIETGQRMIFEDIQNDDHYRTLSREGKSRPPWGFESALLRFSDHGEGENRLATLQPCQSKPSPIFAVDETELNSKTIAGQIGVPAMGKTPCYSPR
jgi:hypothetical protein